MNRRLRITVFVLPSLTLLAIPRPVRGAVGDTIVRTWPDGRTAAYSFTHDDNREDHWLISGPALTQRGLQGTYYVNPGWWPTHPSYRNAFQGLALQGHEIASHTMFHQRCQIVPAEQDPQNVYFHSLDEIWADSAACIAAITQIQPWRQVISFAYPGGVNTPPTREVIRANFLSARLSSVGVNWNLPTPPDMCAIKPCYCGLDGWATSHDLTYAGLTSYLAAALSSGGWVVEEYHDIHPGGYAGMNLQAYYEHLDDVVAAVNAGTLWVAPAGDVVLYLLSRNAAVLTLTDGVPGGVTISLDDHLPGDIYTRSLTLETTVPDSTIGVSVMRNGLPVPFVIASHNGRTWARYSAPADGTATRVQWDAAAPVLYSGDLNCDGLVDFADIDAFVAALGSASAYAAAFPNCDRMLADVNHDNAVDFADIDGFVALLNQ